VPGSAPTCRSPRRPAGPKPRRRSNSISNYGLTVSQPGTGETPALPATTLIALGLILLAGVGLRAWILATPLGEADADESVVGLMALHILAGEFPAFYWGQPYLGSLEAYLVAAAFWLTGASNLVLKLVPGLVYLAFALFVFFGTRRDYGDGVALLSLLYLALPPSFLALWSMKARGGYVELLALGQALLFLTPWATQARSVFAWRTALLGLVAGLLLWTHVLGVIYVLPAGLYLLLRLRWAVFSPALLAGLAGLLLGLTPVLIYNLQQDWETVSVLSGVGATPQTFQDNLRALLQIGLPVMVGLGQATSSPLLFADHWHRWPASWPWVPPVLLGLLLLGLLPSLSALLAPMRECLTTQSCRPAERDAARHKPLVFFGLAVIALTPLLISLGRFGDLVAEPRYALPLYSTVPLFAAAVWMLPSIRWAPPTSTLVATPGRGPSPSFSVLVVVGLVFVINTYSLVTADPRLNLPTTAAGSNEANRQELITYLQTRGLTEIYADYWLAYPIMFESRETILASVSSGGYDRLASYAYFVAVSERPAFAFVSGSVEQAAFDRRLEAVGGRAIRERVSIYEVYSAVEPLDQVRP
jgi:hypothetical protein